MKAGPRHLVLGSALTLGAAGLLFYRGEQQKAAVLQKIITLETHLASNNRFGTTAAAGTMRSIAVLVFKNRNQARDVVVLSQSQQIINRTRTISDTLHRLQRQLRAAAGEAATGRLRYPATASLAPFGIARQLAPHLNRYSAFIRQYVPGAPLLTETSGLGGTPWFYAQGAPLAVALASLTRLEAHVRRQASEALNVQSTKVGSGCCMCFDKIVAMAIASSNTVAPGAPYEAQLFIMKAASSDNPVMTANGKPVSWQPSGEGLIEFRVPPLQPNQPDTVRAWWQGTITARVYPKDTTWQLRVPYLIVRKAAL